VCVGLREGASERRPALNAFSRAGRLMEHVRHAPGFSLAALRFL
jgi:hypothetical protein